MYMEERVEIVGKMRGCGIGAGFDLRRGVRAVAWGHFTSMTPCWRWSIEVFAAALLRAYDVLEFGRFGGIG
jgi:hypothetical protein